MQLEVRTPGAAFAALPAAERQELVQLALADARLSSVEERIARVERHLAGDCLDDCPCRPWNYGGPAAIP